MIDETIKKILTFCDTLLGIEYVWWNSTMEDCGPQSYSRIGEIPNLSKIKETGMNCVGIINLIRKKLDLEIPGLKENDAYAGGTYEWFKYLREKGKLKKLDLRKSYPVGTLLLRNYKNGNDQGHVAIIYDTNEKSILFSKLLHCYSSTPFNKHNIHKFHKPGLTVDSSVAESYSWYSNGTYTHICLPEDWLT